MPKDRHRHLLRDLDIHRWHANLSRGSIITADVKLRLLGRFCESTGYQPHALTDLKRKSSETFDNFIMDYVEQALARGDKPNYVKNMLGGVRSWLGHLGLKVDKRIKIPTTDFVDEVVPTRDELAVILRHCDPRARVIASAIAF